MKTVLKIVLISLAVDVVLLLVGVAVLFINAAFPQQHITTDLADYGKYVGNYDNKSAKKFITSFFPDEIKDEFKDVKYSYRAEKFDTYAFEAYLEFRIEDETAFKSYIAEKIGDGATAFEYDPDFKEYIVLDFYLLSSFGNELTIDDAGIGKILYSEKDQRIIYVALAVYDGGATSADFLCVYFERFGIDPVAYQRGKPVGSLGNLY